MKHQTQEKEPDIGLSLENGRMVLEGVVRRSGRRYMLDVTGSGSVAVSTDTGQLLRHAVNRRVRVIVLDLDTGPVVAGRSQPSIRGRCSMSDDAKTLWQTMSRYCIYHDTETDTCNLRERCGFRDCIMVIESIRPEGGDGKSKN